MYWFVSHIRFIVSETLEFMDNIARGLMESPLIIYYFSTAMKLVIVVKTLPKELTTHQKQFSANYFFKGKIVPGLHYTLFILLIYNNQYTNIPFIPAFDFTKELFVGQNGKWLS